MGRSVCLGEFWCVVCSVCLVCGVCVCTTTGV